MERRDDENREMMIQAISSLVYEQWERLNRDPYLVPVGISARHVHLSREHVAQLFGQGYTLTPMKYLSQAGQFACLEQVAVQGPKGSYEKVRILGPERCKSQVEMSAGDCRFLGIEPVVRTSGEIDNKPGIRLKGPCGEVALTAVSYTNLDVYKRQLGMHIEYDRRKEEIGKIAASLVTDSGWVFIGQGTTCYYIARELAKLEEVNVLTNNLLAAQALAKNKQANVIVTGGNLVHSHLYVAGEMFMRNLDKVYISKAFMGVGGADLSAGYTVNYSTELIVYQTIKAIADQLIIVLDSSKFNRTTFLSLGSLTFSDVYKRQHIEG